MANTGLLSLQFAGSHTELKMRAFASSDQAFHHLYTIGSAVMI